MLAIPPDLSLVLVARSTASTLMSRVLSFPKKSKIMFCISVSLEIQVSMILKKERANLLNEILPYASTCLSATSEVCSVARGSTASCFINSSSACVHLPPPRVFDRVSLLLLHTGGASFYIFGSGRICGTVFCYF